MRRRVHGHTVIELLLVCVLFSLAMGLIFGLFNYGHQIFRGRDDHGDGQRQAMLFINRFQREFARAPWPSVNQAYISNSTAQGDLAVSWLSELDDTEQINLEPHSYRPVYQAYVVYYLDMASHTVRRYRQPLVNPTLALSRMLDSDLVAAVSATGYRQISSLAVSWQALDYLTHVPTDLAQDPALFQITTQTANNSSAPYRLEFRVKLLN